MFMISKLMYDSHYKSHNYLVIKPYEADNHIENFYYFRLGAIKREDKVVALTDNKLTIPANGFKTIWSLEKFTFNERVLGIFGNRSTLIQRGIQLINSPSIDPGFNGLLSLGIKNHTSDPIDLHFGDIVGKILFFDVSDTPIDAEKFFKNSLVRKEWKEKFRAGDDMERIAENILNEAKNIKEEAWKVLTEKDSSSEENS